jgi:putative transposase
VQRQFDAIAPNRLWVADFTHVPTWGGMVYVAFVIDAFSRRITGWRAATTMTTALVLDALEHAVWTRGRDGVTGLAGLVHHTDAGSTPRSRSPSGWPPRARSLRWAAWAMPTTTPWPRP